VFHGEAILEAVDDVLIGDVGDCGAHLEEAPGVGSQGLVHLLLDLRQVMTITCSEHGTLEVVDENPLQVLLEVDGVWLEAFEPGDRCGLQCHREVDDLGGVGATRNFDGGGVATDSLPWVLLAVVLGDAEWPKLPRVVAAGDVACERRKAITIFGVMGTIIAFKVS
jgi:hypothetical protein